MSMKPPMHEAFGTVGNTTTEPHKTGHYDGVANEVNSMKPTSGLPNPGGIASTTTVKGTIPTA